MFHTTDGAVVMLYSVKPTLSSFGAFSRRGGATSSGKSAQTPATADIVEISAVARLADRREERREEGLPGLLRRVMVASDTTGNPEQRMAEVIPLTGNGGTKSGASVDRKV